MAEVDPGERVVGALQAHVDAKRPAGSPRRVVVAPSRGREVLGRAREVPSVVLVEAAVVVHGRPVEALAEPRRILRRNAIS